METLLLLERVLRVKFFTALAKVRIGSFGHGFFCGGFTILTSKTFVGNNVNFNGTKVRGRGNLYIGNNFHSGSGIEIITQNHNFNGNALPYDDTYVCKDVYIGDNVWLGNRVIILPGVKINEGAIIQAGSVVVNEIPTGAIAGGHPAKVFAYRDMSHYNALKTANKFH